MKKIGMVISAAMIVALSGGVTFWGLMTLFPKQQPPTPSNTQQLEQPVALQQPIAAQKEVVPLVAEATFTPKSILQPDSLPEMKSPTFTNTSKRLVAVDGKLVVIVGNIDGSLIARLFHNSQQRNDELVRSMGRAILTDYRSHNPDGIVHHEKGTIAVPVDGAKKAIAFQKVHYEYSKADGKQYRAVCLLRHGSARGVYATFEKLVADWTDDDEARYMAAVKVVESAE
ncbi:MAG: hypothetical protein Q4A34_03120 [Candidatus Saccharibacteria bacterium]|nr:hypothetical protein [Candidatus Saccharibacteria bacterium]